MGHLYNNIIETVGNTPVIRINRLAPKGINLFVKAEAFNPGGSVKDRLALGVIEDAEKKGLLKPGQTVVEATSGNTGIGLALVCAAKGYPLVVTMAESFSIERRKLLRFFGAKVVLTPAAEKGTGMVRKAEELAEKNGWFLTRQFENEANADIHSRTTAQEILDDFDGEGLDYWVTGYGTGGTLKGVSRVLKEKRPDVKIVVCEPDNSQLMASGIAQVRGESHPQFQPHIVQGWTPDFIPKLADDAATAKHIDQLLAIAGDDALRYSRALAAKEGIFTGISAGATFAGAMKIAESAPEGTTILCMLPDTGERYLTTMLFEGVREDMNDEEIALSESTPSARFGKPTAAPAVPKEGEAEAAEAEAEEEEAPKDVEPEAVSFVEHAVGDKQSPVVMFALEWCEFCWAVRKMLNRFGVPFRSVDLDSVDYQKENWGRRIRRALIARTGVLSIPQVFVGGEFIGGATELFDAWRDGKLQSRLQAAGVTFDESVGDDPYSFMPGWVHPR